MSLFFPPLVHDLDFEYPHQSLMCPWLSPRQVVPFEGVMEGGAWLEEVGHWGQVHMASAPGSFLSHTLFPLISEDDTSFCCQSQDTLPHHWPRISRVKDQGLRYLRS